MARIMNYIITFPQKDKARKDGWVLLKNAKSKDYAMRFAHWKFGGQYALIYEEFDFQEGYFPHGQLEEYDIAGWFDYVY